jgi:hypothetical protein
MGKARVARNAFKGDWRGQLRELRKLLREHERTLREVEGAAVVSWDLQ